ncbi:stem 28 kDa glycoprotein [Lolium perenne]|uniref:stem 28 kDa glycoprotein n=1 Tax=Lolium perenne TaxID=4522 RepID=UPI0021F69335|nr:stem 28 kDa glycoprotein-like [Lolium perenne]
MAMARMLLLLVTMALLGSCSASELTGAPVIHPLRQLLGSGRVLASRGGVPCDSWMLGVEAHNVRDWKTVPANCEGYVGHYMLGSHYRRDSKVVVDEALAYAETLKLAGKGKEVWVFDIDETTLSNLPYYAKHGFGTKPFNATSFNAYVLEGSALALPETKRLYKKLLSIGVKPVLLTGRTEDQRAITIANLLHQGFSGWMNLLLKQPGFKGSAIAYKSGERQKLQDAGYVIVGNIGDQWSDILGAPEGTRTFKLPDPMYYIG